MIEVLVGMIGSGKSSYARCRADQGAVVICHDALVSMLHARYRYEFRLKPFYLEVMTLIARETLAKDLDVVIDRTHLERRARKIWVDEGLRIGVPVLAVPFKIETPEVHARRRHDSDARGHDYETWLRVAGIHYLQAAAEPLDWEAEGFSGLVTVGENDETTGPDDRGRAVRPVRDGRTNPGERPAAGSGGAG